MAHGLNQSSILSMTLFAFLIFYISKDVKRNTLVQRSYKDSDIIPKTRTNYTRLTTQKHKLLPPPGVLLGPLGGIGNQLFQYACSYSLSKELQWPLYLRKISKLENRQFTQKHRTFALDHFSIPEIQLIDSNTNVTHVYYSGDLDYLTRNFSKNATNGNGFIQLGGYCQSMAYWNQSVEDIYRMLQPSESVRESLTKSLREILEDIEASESIAVHVRRGDFLAPVNYAFFVPIAYQRVAIPKMVDILRKKKDVAPVFFIFSDDIQFVKDKFADFEEKWRFVYVSSLKSTSLQDLYLMKRCKHIIFPNSTFSWWAAFLNSHENKTVIASYFNPIWFNGTGKPVIHGENYHPKDWILIDVFSGENV